MSIFSKIVLAPFNFINSVLLITPKVTNPNFAVIDGNVIYTGGKDLNVLNTANGALKSPKFVNLVYEITSKGQVPEEYLGVKTFYYYAELDWSEKEDTIDVPPILAEWQTDPKPIAVTTEIRDYPFDANKSEFENFIPKDDWYLVFDSGVKIRIRTWNSLTEYQKELIVNSVPKSFTDSKEVYDYINEHKADLDKKRASIKSSSPTSATNNDKGDNGENKSNTTVYIVIALVVVVIIVSIAYIIRKRKNK